MPTLTKTQLRRASMAALLFSCSVVGVRAQEASPSPTPGISLEKQILIKELLVVTNSKGTVDAMLNDLWRE